MTKFNYIGPINPTGYGVASSSYLAGLFSLGENIGFRPIGGVDTNTLKEANIAKEQLEKAHSSFDPSKPTFVFWHFHDILRQIQPHNLTGPKVAFSTFEVDGFKDKEKTDVGHFDIVCTASTWGTDILRNNFPNVAEPIPHAFKRTEDDSFPIFNRTNDEVLDSWKRLLKFNLTDPLILSTSGKFESRKGHPELFSACAELSKDRQVLLTASVHNPFILDGLPFDYLNANGFGPFFMDNDGICYNKNNLYLFFPNRTATRNELHNLLSFSHYFISPSKAEGWNLPLFEMMSRGVPTIASINTAHSDYCSAESTIEVLADSEQPTTKALDGRFFDGTFNWNNITHSSILSSLSRSIEVLEDPDQRKSISSEAFNQTSKFSWQQSAKKIAHLMMTF